MKTRALVGGLVLTLWFLLIDGAAAQDLSPLEKLENTRVALRDYAAAVRDWKWWSNVSLAIVVLIGSLGAATAVLQRATVKWKGMATAVAGAIVSLATVLSTTIVPADYKTLSRQAARGKRLVALAEGWLDRGLTANNDSVRREALTAIERHFQELAALDAGSQAVASADSPHWPFSENLVAVVHAAQSRTDCGCLGKVPKAGKGFTYACGTASAGSFTEAHDQAVHHASRQIAANLASPVQSTGADRADALVGYVRRVSTEIESCPEPGRAMAVSVLIRFPQSFATQAAMAAFVSKLDSPATDSGRVPLRLRVDQIRVEDDGSSGATGWVFDIFVDRQLVKRLPNFEYDDRLATRVLTFSGTRSISADVELPAGRYWMVEVRGKRSFGNDVADGAVALTGVGSSAEIQVRHKNPKEGAFVFKVSVDRR